MPYICKTKKYPGSFSLRIPGYLNRKTAMTKVQPLSGIYARQDKYFRKIIDKTLDANGLMICQRQSTTSTKPSLFVLYIHPDGSRTYLSSLYPRGLDPGSYWFDYDGVKYTLKTEGDGVRVGEVKK